MSFLNRRLIFACVMLSCFLVLTAFGAVEIFSEKWSFPVYGGAIAIHALDSVNHVVYVGSYVTVGRTNLLYAVNIVDGSTIWWYNTSLPVNYVSHFNSNGDYALAAGTGSSVAGYVYCFNLLNNITRWVSTKLTSSVVSIGSVKSYVAVGEDVMAGLANGTVLRLRGDNGTVLWGYPCNGTVAGVTESENGSIIVGTRQTIPTVESYVYYLEENGTLRWSFPRDDLLNMVKRFDDVNSDGEPEVIAVFSTDGLIHVLDGKTGTEVSPWPFDNHGDNIKDFLCTEDYTGDGFPDIICGTEGGNLTIVNGLDATLFRKSLAPIGNTVTYIQYMYFYEDGVQYYNRALAVSLLDSNSTTTIYGVNASDLTLMQQFKTTTTARNLLQVGNFSSSYVGDLLFTVNNVVYYIAGTEIIVPEFPSQILAFIILVVLSSAMVLPRKRLPRKN